MSNAQTPVATYTIEEMAFMLKIKPATMHYKSWRQNNGCPLIKKGRRTLAIKAEFDAWMSDSHKLSI